MTKEELSRILAAHKAWLDDEPGGNRADLSEADLRGADLRGADLSGADLSEADLREADLREADLRGADLSEADLSEADLRGADLRRTDLRRANLSRANLSRANLRRANLSRANLSGAKGLLQSCNYLDAHFERTPDGYIAYKTFGGEYKPPEKWTISPGSVIEENVDPNRADVCGCGINVAPLDWVLENYGDGDIWKVLIRWEWLVGVVVPYNTDGKIRCERVELLEVMQRD